MNELIEWLKSFGTTALTKAFYFSLILITGLIIIKIVMTLINRALAKSKLEKVAHTLIKSVTRAVMLILLGLILASSLGIDVTGVVALASVASLAISLSLQNSIMNLIGGFTIVYTKPFHSGDYVEIAGRSGTVSEVGMAYTKLITPDNKLIQIPNSSVIATEIINYSCTGTRRVDVAVSASYNAPVDKVLAALKEAASVEGIIEEKGIYTGVTSYGDHAISYVVRVWTTTDKYWDVYNKTNYNVKVIFDRDGIEMTYPHLNVHLDK
ncbi:MAG: mechanosensitive ion channel family protein [Eubacteriales bacterium]